MTAVLTPEQIEQFNTEGYVTPVQIMDAAEAGTLRSKLEATEAARGGKLAPTERSKAHMLFKWLDDLIRDPRVLDPIEQLIGPNILCWNTLFWIKEAQSPSFRLLASGHEVLGPLQRESHHRLAGTFPGFP